MVSERNGPSPKLAKASHCVVCEISSVIADTLISNDDDRLLPQRLCDHTFLQCSSTARALVHRLSAFILRIIPLRYLSSSEIRPRQTSVDMFVPTALIVATLVSSLVTGAVLPRESIDPTSANHLTRRAACKTENPGVCQAQIDNGACNWDLTSEGRACTVKTCKLVSSFALRCGRCGLTLIVMSQGWVLVDAAGSYIWDQSTASGATFCVKMDKLNCGLKNFKCDDKQGPAGCVSTSHLVTDLNARSNALFALKSILEMVLLSAWLSLLTHRDESRSLSPMCPISACRIMPSWPYLSSAYRTAACRCTGTQSRVEKRCLVSFAATMRLPLGDFASLSHSLKARRPDQ